MTNTYPFFFLGSFLFFTLIVIVCHGFLSYAGEIIYDLFDWDFLYYIGTALECYRVDYIWLEEQSLFWFYVTKTFWYFWAQEDLVAKAWAANEGLVYICKSIGYFLLSRLPFYAYFYARCPAHYGVLWLNYRVLVAPANWMFPTLAAFQQTQLYASLFLHYYPQCIALFNFAYPYVVQTLVSFYSHLLSSIAFAYSYISNPLSEALLHYLTQSDGSLFFQWLLFYGYFDFLNWRFLLGIVTAVLSEFVYSAQIYYLLYNYVFYYPFSLLERWLFERWTDICFFFIGDLFTGYSWSYFQWVHLWMFLDDLSLNFKYKPLDAYYSQLRLLSFQLWIEVLAFENPEISLTEGVLEHTKGPEGSPSFLSFLYEPYIAWTIRRSSNWLYPGASHAYGPALKNVNFSALNIPVFNFLFIIGFFLFFSKGFRYIIMPRLDYWYSTQYEWTQARARKSQPFFDALVHVPPNVKQRYKETFGALELRYTSYESREKPWKFWNLASMRLGDLMGTENFLEALSRYITLSYKNWYQRLGYKDLVIRLWKDRDAEEFFKYIFRRKKGPAKKLKYDLHDYPMAFRLPDPEEAKEEFKTVDQIAFFRWMENLLKDASAETNTAIFPAHFDARVLALGQRLFGVDFCNFMEKHDFDFLDIQRDPALGYWHTNFLNDYDRSLFIAAYLFNKDIHMHLAWKHDWLILPSAGGTPDEYFDRMHPQYTGFLHRNLGFIQDTLDYFAWIDDFFLLKNCLTG